MTFGEALLFWLAKELIPFIIIGGILFLIFLFVVIKSIWDSVTK